MHDRDGPAKLEHSGGQGVRRVPLGPPHGVAGSVLDVLMEASRFADRTTTCTAEGIRTGIKHTSEGGPMVYTTSRRCPVVGSFEARWGPPRGRGSERQGPLPLHGLSDLEMGDVKHYPAVPGQKEKDE